MAALWRPLGLLHFLVCATRVLQWGSKKLQKQFKTNGLGRFGGILLGRPTWTIWTTNAFPCSVRLVFRFCKAFPCSVALIFIDEIAFPCRRRSIFIRSAPSGGSELVCLDGSVWIRSAWVRCVWIRSVWIRCVWVRSVWILSVWIRSVWIPSVWIRSVWIPSVWIRSVWISPISSPAPSFPPPASKPPPSLLSASAGC